MAIVLQVQVQVALQVPALVDTVVVDSLVVLRQAEVRLAMLQVEVKVDMDQMDTQVDTVVVDSQVVLHRREVRLATLQVEVMVDKDLVPALEVLDLLVVRRDTLLVAAKVVMAMEAKDQLDLQAILEVMEVDGLKGAQAQMVMDLLVVVELPVVMVEDSPKRLQLRNMWIGRCQQNRS